MTASRTLAGPDEGRVYIECDGCGKQHTIRTYSITKKRTHAAAHLGWVRTGEPGDRRDWCPDCETPAPDPVDGALFDLMDMEASA